MEVKGTLGYFYNRFDFIIRFLYCRMPFLSKLLFWKIYSSDFKKLDEKFEEMRKVLYTQKFDFKGKTCLELGPGNSYINAYNFLMLGAKQVILVDKFPRHIKTNKQKKYFNDEIEYIQKKYKKELFFINNGKIDFHYIKLIPKDLVDADIGKVDFAYSISVFEHIRDVEANIKKLAEILKKYGLMYHFIDLRDPYNFNNPFLFYKYSDEVWNKYLTREGVSYTNRLRYDDFLDLFGQNKFNVIEKKIVIDHFGQNRLINSNFAQKSKKVLGIGHANLCLKKAVI